MLKLSFVGNFVWAGMRGSHGREEFVEAQLSENLTYWTLSN